MCILIQNKGSFIYKIVRELNKSAVPILTDLLNSAFISCFEKKIIIRLVSAL